jgi:hypothetical protein
MKCCYRKTKKYLTTAVDLTRIDYLSAEKRVRNALVLSPGFAPYFVIIPFTEILNVIYL